MNKRHLLLLVAVTLLGAAFHDTIAQLPPSQHVQIIARRVPEGVILRWAPSSPVLFAEGRASGYRLERADVSAGGTIGAFAPLFDGQPIKPFEQGRYDGLALDFTGSDSTRMVYRTFARSVLYDPVDPSLSASERVEALNAQFGFALLAADRDTIAALGLGLQFNDEDVVPTGRYAYRITLIAREREPESMDTVIVGTELHRVISRAQDVKVDEGDTEVTLRWPIIDGYSAYMIHRSSDRGRTWTPLTDAPMITLITGDTIPTGEFHRDTALVNYTMYTYRLYGYTAFADEELIAELPAMPRDRTPPGAPTEVRAIEVRPGVVRVTWRMHDPVAADLRGFYVGKDTADMGTFPRMSGLLAPAIREYVDSSGRFATTNYYTIDAVDTAGNVARSFSAYVVLIDSTPPAEPVLLGGEIDTNGIVTIRFERPSDRDYMGYRLLRANDSTHEFSVVRERFTNDSLDVSSETVLTDTIEVRTLTRYVYYRMYALDFHYNASQMTPMLRVERPDVVPPVPPVITGYEVLDTAVVVDFVPSSSEDAARHVMLRRPSGTEQWDSIAAIPEGALRFVDRSAAVNASYDYAVQAVDRSGLRSFPSNEITGRRYDNGLRPPVEGLVARYDSVAKVIDLQWEYSDIPEGHSFLIYRSDGDNLTSYAVVDTRGARTFTDRRPPATATVRYAIKVVTSSGAESLVSTAVSVNLR